jgi:hypothetical protein
MAEWTLATRTRRPSLGAVRDLAVVAVVALAVGAAVALVDPLPVAAVAALAVVGALGLTRTWGVAACAAGVLLVPVPAMERDALGPLPLGPVLAAATFGYAAALFAVQRRRVAVDRTVLVAVAATVALALVQGAFGAFDVVEATITLTLVWSAGLLLGTLVAEDPRRLMPLLALAIPIALLALADAVLGRNVWEAVVGPSRLSGGPSGLTRGRGTLGHPLVAGAVFVLLGLAVLAAPVRRRTPLAVVLLLAALLTVSRAAILGALLGLAAFLVASHASRRRLLGVAVAGAVGVTALFAVPSLDRFQSTFAARIVEGRQNDDVRASALAILADDLQSRPQELLLGSGLRAAEQQLRAQGGNRGLNTYDSQYVTFVYDLGILPLAGLVAALVVALRRAHVRRPTLLWVAAGAGAAMFAVFDGLYWFSTALLFWLVIGWATADRAPPPEAPAVARGAAPRPADGPARAPAPHRAPT